MKAIKRYLAPTLAASCALLLLAGCGDPKPAGDSATATDKGTIRLAYVNWSEGVAVTYLLDALLTDMGYTVKTTMADAAPIYTSVAEGQQDVMVETWLPTTHKSYYEQFGSRVELISTWFEDAKIGLVVPKYVEIDSIEQLNDVKAAFKGKLTGIDAGAGVMSCTDDAIEQYGLDYTLITSSGPAMTAALKGAIDKNEAIAVTGWAPHWKFARYELKFLDDPKGVYGGAEKIQSAARKGFSEDFPEVAAFFGRMKFNGTEIGSLMDKLETSTQGDEKAIREWISENQALVDSWMAK